MFRRGFFGVVLSSLFSGCIGLSEGGGGFIEIHNRTNSVRDASVTLIQQESVTLIQQESQETVLDDTYRVEPDTERRIDDAFNGGVFEVEVTVDDGRSKEYELGIGRCPGIRFFIGIEPDELILDQDVCD
jgi:hypothetical protein